MTQSTNRMKTAENAAMHVQADAAGQADRQRRQHDAGVLGVLDLGAVAHQPGGADHAEGARQVGADDQHHDRADDRQDDLGLDDGGLARRRAAPPGPQREHRAEQRRQRQADASAAVTSSMRIRLLDFLAFALEAERDPARRPPSMTAARKRRAAARADISRATSGRSGPAVPDSPNLLLESLRLPRINGVCRRRRIRRGRARRSISRRSRSAADGSRPASARPRLRSSLGGNLTVQRRSPGPGQWR